MKRVSALVLMACGAFAGPAWGQSVQPAASIYAVSDVESLQAVYRNGWMTNYREVFLPLLSAEQRSRLAGVQFRFEPRDPANEPFAFHSTRDTVFASASSLKFLDDLSVAAAWLSINQRTPQTIADYALMLRYWRDRRVGHSAERPPKPLEALCIPADTLSDQRVNERANRIFDDIVVFILLHEIGHVVLEHPPNIAVSPERSRANEEAADNFALDLFGKINAAPLGLSLLFTVMGQLWENRADYTSDEEYWKAVQSHTHPLSPARLKNLSSQIAAAGRGFNGDSRTIALQVSLDIAKMALLLADPDLQRFSARIGITVQPEDLAPRPLGYQLTRSCREPAPTDAPFGGDFRGKLQIGNNSIDLDAVLTQTGDRVAGSYSFGAGFARIEGVVAGSRLSFEWMLNPDRGHGIIALQDGIAQGTWGAGTAIAGGGSVSLKRTH